MAEPARVADRRIKQMTLEKGAKKSRVYKHILSCKKCDRFKKALDDIKRHILSCEKCDRLKKALDDIKQHIQRTILYQISIQEGFYVTIQTEFNTKYEDSAKARGVIYTLRNLSDEQKRKGVIAVSTGSFARTLCYYGKKFEIPVTVVMPTSASDEIVMELEIYAKSCVTVLVQGSDMIEAHQVAMDIAKNRGLHYLDWYDHPNMIFGQATWGLKILELMRDVNTVILPMRINDWGLTTGIAMAIKHIKSYVEVIAAHLQQLDPLINNIKKYTNLPKKFAMPLKQYAWYQDRRLMPNYWLDNILSIDKKMVAMAMEILSRETYRPKIDEAIGIAAAVAEADKLKGKKVVIVSFGNVDSSEELTKKPASLEPRAGSSRSLE